MFANSSYIVACYEKKVTVMINSVVDGCFSPLKVPKLTLKLYMLKNSQTVKVTIFFIKSTNHRPPKTELPITTHNPIDHQSTPPIRQFKSQKTWKRKDIQFITFKHNWEHCSVFIALTSVKETLLSHKTHREKGLMVLVL